MNNEMVDSSRAFFLIGPPLSGKSTLIDTLAENKLVENGGKTLSNSEILKFYSFKCKYLNQKLSIIEIPSNLPEEKLLNQVKSMFLKALSEGLNIKGFILTEPLTSNALSLYDSLNRLISACEPQSVKSTIVLACKSDLFPEENYERVAELCRGQSIPCVKWTNFLSSLNENDQKKQFRELAEALSSIVPYTTKWMSEIENEIKNIATGLLNDNPRPSPEEILDKAEELASIEPKIGVLKTRTSYRRIEITLSNISLRALSGSGRQDKSQRSSIDDVMHIDEPFTEIYYEMQSPSASSLQAKAEKSLDLIMQSQYLQQAAKIKLEQYKYLMNKI